MTFMQTSKQQPPKKPPLTDGERHERFAAMVSEVGASTDASDFDAAFNALDKRPKKAT
ncbi:MAG: hypothetical protein ABIU18_08875 [Novosphingobium sp.]